jgi:bifunctional non-homologous end joining protein LigD
VARVLIARHPDTLTQEFAKKDRGDRILLDVGRNGYSATFAAPYAGPPQAGRAGVGAVPWEEIEQGRVGPRTFTLRTMADRVATVGDVWSDMPERGASLGRAMELLT